MYEILKNQTRAAAPRAIDFTRALIQAPSPSLKEGKVAGLVLKHMKELGYDDATLDEFGNVVGVIHGMKASPTVLLLTHLDTVEAADPELWDADPWSGKLENGRLFGLGAADCKGGIAAQIYAGALLKHSLLPLKGTLVVAATVAEEHGYSVGVRGLMETTLPAMEIKPDYVIMGEPTGLRLYYGHDGWIEFDIRVDGDNEFFVEDAANAIFRELDRVNKPGGNGGARLAVQSPRHSEAAGRRQSIIRVYQRLQEGEAADDAIAAVKRNAELAAPAASRVTVAVDVVQEAQQLYTGQTLVVRNLTAAWETDPFSPLIERARHALAAAGLPAKPGKFHLRRLGMGTAGSVIANEHKLPVIGFGPGEEEHAHVENEYVETDKIADGIFGTAAIVHTLIGVPVFGWTGDDF